jgi:hypothetical protein
MPVSSARSINSASDMRAHTHAFLNSSQAFIAHASLLTRAAILVLLAWTDVALASVFFLEDSAAIRMPLTFFFRTLIACIRVSGGFADRGLHHLNNDCKNSRSRSPRWFRWRSALCFPLAPHPRDVVADFVISCVVAHASTAQSLSITEYNKWQGSRRTRE